MFKWKDSEVSIYYLKLLSLFHDGFRSLEYGAIIVGL